MPLRGGRPISRHWHVAAATPRHGQATTGRARLGGRPHQDLVASQQINHGSGSARAKSLSAFAGARSPSAAPRGGPRPAAASAAMRSSSFLTMAVSRSTMRLAAASPRSASRRLKLSHSASSSVPFESCEAWHTHSTTRTFDREHARASWRQAGHLGVLKPAAGCEQPTRRQEQRPQAIHAGGPCLLC